MQKPVDIGSRLELFVDDMLIERMDGEARLRLHQPTPREIVMVFDRPWEGNACAHYNTVFFDGGRYRMYYIAGMTKGNPNFTCYAESADGIHWTRPDLEQFEFAGSKKNNIVIWEGWQQAGARPEYLVPFRDGNPDAKPDELYKALVYSWATASRPQGLQPLKSADGIHWSQMSDKPVLTHPYFDTQNLAFWDAVRGEYRAYQRGFRDGVLRDIITSTSKDFIHWTKGEFLDYGSTPLEHFYTNAITPYLRAPSVFLGFPMRFLPRRQVRPTEPEHFQLYWDWWLQQRTFDHTPYKEEAERRGITTKQYFAEVYFAGVSDTVLITSRDGLHFDRRFMEAFIRLGLDIGNWGHRNNMTSWGILQTGPEELSLYVGEHYELASNHLRRYKPRLDGFVSVRAPYRGGTLRTRPLMFEGKELVINYSTSAAGSIQVGLETANGKAIKGFTVAECPEIYGDQIERVVRWNQGSDLGAYSGKPVRLKFEMRDADLFSFRFR